MGKLLHHDVFGRNVGHEHTRDEVSFKFIKFIQFFYKEQINYPCFLNKLNKKIFCHDCDT